MAQKMTFLGLIREVLNRTDRPLTPREIWDKAVQDGLDEKLNSKGKTPWASVGRHLYGQDENSDIIQQGNPARFFLKARADEMPNQEKLEVLLEQEITLKEKKTTWKEKDLYPLLTYFVFSNESINSISRGKKIYTKAIPHEASKKKAGYSSWVYPDMVGFYLPQGDFGVEVVSLSKILGDNLIRLYSFELKKFIHKGNYRESFFQAVSNSSWANEGYLVTADIADDQDLLSELGRLSESFGIGIITLDIEDVDSSKIVFPATPKVSIGWETMNKISEENPVFQSFIKNMVNAFTIDEVHQDKYEPVLDSDSLAAYIKDKITSKQ